jgi:hypothetical protein
MFYFGGIKDILLFPLFINSFKYTFAQRFVETNQFLLQFFIKKEPADKSTGSDMQII